MMKRFIAKILVFALTLTACAVPTAVFAQKTAETLSNEDYLLAEKLEAFGAIDGIPETLDVTVTRREMAELICKYMRMPVSNDGYATTPFKDVKKDDSAIGAITALFNAKIITGDGLNFYPDQNLNYDDAIVMVVNALGYKLMAVREGGYPTGYHRIAIKLGMLKELSIQSGRADITLRDVYKLFEAGFAADAVTVNYLEGDDANYVVSDTEDYLSDTYGITTHKGIVTGNEDTSLSGGQTNLSDEQIEIDFKVYDTPGYLYATSIGKSVIYYLRDNGNGEKEIAYVEENRKANQTTKVDAEDLLKDKTTDTRVYYETENNKEKHIDFLNGIYVLYNGRTYKGYGNLKNVLPASGYIEALDNNGDNVCEVLFVFEYKNAVVASVDEWACTVTDTEGNTYEWDTEQDDVKIYMMPEKTKVSGIGKLQKDDVLTVLESKSGVALTTVYVSRNVVSGVVTEISNEQGIFVNDAYYKKAVGCTGEPVEVGMNADFYLDFTGKIARVAYSDAVSENEKYAVLSGIETGKTGSIDSTVSVRLYTEEGTFLTAPLANSLKINEVRYEANGKDREKVIALLCKDYKNEEGKYAVNSAYVLRYVLFDGKLTSIDTGLKGGKGNLNVLADNCTEISPRSTAKMLGITKSDSTKLYAMYTDKETKLFIAPVDGNLDDLEGYGMLTRLEEKRYRKGTDSWMVYTDSSSVYSLNTAEVPHADAVLLRGTSIGSAISGASSTLYLVQKITSAVDKEGNATKKLYFTESSGKLFASEVTLTIGGEVSKISCDDPKLTSLKPGTIVQIGTDINGYINAVSVQATYDAATEKVTAVASFSSAMGETENVRMMGKVVSVDNEKHALCFEDEYGNQFLAETSEVAVTIYRASTEKVTSGSVASIAEGDQIVMRTSSYYKAREIIVYK